MTWKLLLKNKKIRIVLSQALPKDFLGFILVVLLSSDDFTEERNVEKLIECFPDDPYFSSLFEMHLLLILNPLFYEIVHRSSSASIFFSNTSSVFLVF